jgi:hypothetical protein
LVSKLFLIYSLFFLVNAINLEREREKEKEREAELENQVKEEGKQKDKKIGKKKKGKKKGAEDAVTKSTPSTPALSTKVSFLFLM